MGVEGRCGAPGMEGRRVGVSEGKRPRVPDLKRTGLFGIKRF